MRDRILLIEDDSEIRLVVADLLEEAGFDVSIARNGDEALRQLREGQAPSVILLDLMMPVMDGWTFRAEQMKDARIAGIPVVLISGAGDAAETARGLAAADLLIKPFKAESLIAVVRTHSKRSGAGS
jgi:DNA-binding response OmpR family regulator